MKDEEKENDSPRGYFITAYASVNAIREQREIAVMMNTTQFIINNFYIFDKVYSLRFKLSII